MYCEIQIDSSLLVHALKKAGMFARMYNFNFDGENVLAIVQVQGENMDLFEAELASDTILNTWEQIHTTGELHEYRVEYSREMNVEGYRKIFSHYGSLVQAVYRNDWRLHMFFPKKENLMSYERVLKRLGFQPSTERILQSHPHQTNALTEKQRELLYLAKKRGYFKNPRDVELSDLADQLNISTASASERLRRGLDNVLSEIFIEREI